MQDDAPITLRPPHKLKKKESKNQILEEIRKSLCIPDDIPEGGPELKKYLKKVGPNRLRMAMDPIMPLYNKHFKGKFTLQKLYRWASNNGKIHKRNLIQSEEIEQHVLEIAKKNLDRGCSKKSLQVELAHVISQDDPSFGRNKVSKSTIGRWMKADRERDSQQGYKKVKTDANCYHNASPEDISTQQHSPNNDEPLFKQLFGFSLDQNLDVEAFLTRTDVWASRDCTIALDNLFNDL